MMEFLFLESNTAFTAALVFSLGLLILEIVMMLMGMSSQVDLGETPDVDIEGFEINAEVETLDISIEELATVDTLLDKDVLGDLKALILEGTDTLDSENPITAAPNGFVHWTGLGAAPVLIWLAIFCFLFSSTGFVLTATTSWLFALDGWMTAAIALIPALTLTGMAARTFGRLLPQVESYGANNRFHGHQGEVSHGEATMEREANVMFRDQFNNLRQQMAKALKDETITQGTKVMLLRDKNGEARIVSLCNKN